MRAHRIGSFVTLGVYTVLAAPAQAAEFASLAGRGSTLTLVGLVTLVLAALVFGMFHWIEAAQARRVSGSPEPVDAHKDDGIDDGVDVPAPKLAIVPANPMLDALSRKQGGVDAELGNAPLAGLDDGAADSQLAAAQ